MTKEGKTLRARGRFYAYLLKENAVILSYCTRNIGIYIHTSSNSNKPNLYKCILSSESQNILLHDNILYTKQPNAYIHSLIEVHDQLLRLFLPFSNIQQLFPCLQSLARSMLYLLYVWPSSKCPIRHGCQWRACSLVNFNQRLTAGCQGSTSFPSTLNRWQQTAHHPALSE